MMRKYEEIIHTLKMISVLKKTEEKMRSHFRKISPMLTMSIAYTYVAIIGLILYFTGFYEGNTFFNWGPPIVFFGKTIEKTSTFYGLHVLIFFHQIINNCVNSIVYAWILNSVQDPKTTRVEYRKKVALLLINFFDVYSELDMVFIIGGFMSQISFVCTVMLANIITSTYINNRYLSLKEETQEEIQDYRSLDTVRIQS